MKNIILVSGKLQSGKNQFAEYMTDYLEFSGKTVSGDLFAKGLKDGSLEDFKSLQGYLNTKVYDLKKQVYEACDVTSEKGAKLLLSLEELEIRDENYYEDKTDLTRIILQIYGTEIFRNRVDINHWINQLIKRVQLNEADVIIVTDTRFENEIELLKAMEKYSDDTYNVTTIRINRDLDRPEGFNEHFSETGLDGFKEFDYVVRNDDKLDYLNSCALEIADDIVFLQKF